MACRNKNTFRQWFSVELDLAVISDLHSTIITPYHDGFRYLGNRPFKVCLAVCACEFSLYEWVIVAKQCREAYHLFSAYRELSREEFFRFFHLPCELCVKMQLKIQPKSKQSHEKWFYFQRHTLEQHVLVSLDNHGNKQNIVSVYVLLITIGLDNYSSC